jgi:PAS domain S-box-containing protein
MPEPPLDGSRPAAIEEHMEALFESAPNGVAAIDADGALIVANTPMARLFGYAREELIGRPVWTLWPPGLQGDYAELQADVAEAAGAAIKRELRGLRKDGSDFPVEIALSAFKPGAPGTLLMIVIDIAERKRAEEHQHLLIGELHHRTQNIFAVVQAVANRSLSGERTLEDARRVFLNRLHALSRTYTTLTEGAWRGAELEKILRDELTAFSARIDIGGDPVMIQPSAAQTFALIFHELATNAIKYGALSVSSGSLTVRWTVRGERNAATFELSWREQGGPPVSPPARKGYGQTILEDGARHIGEPRITYAPEGLRYDLTASVKSIGWTLSDLPAPRMFWRPHRAGVVD